MVVTHDRWFLDEVSTDTWEVHDRIVEPFEGGYAAYVLQRVERDRSAAASESKRQNLHAQGARLAASRRARAHDEAQVPHRCRGNALIANEPPVRDSVSLAQLAVARLGKDVVDLLDASCVSLRRHARCCTTSSGASRRASAPASSGSTAPASRRCSGSVAGTRQPTTGRVKRGKTVQIAMLDQRLAELDDIADERVQRRRRAAEVDAT